MRVCMYTKLLCECVFVCKYNVLLCACAGHVCSSLSICDVLMCVHMYINKMY